MFEDLTSWENLLLAYRRASQGKRGHPNVAAFEHRLEDHLIAQQTELRNRTYRPGAYRSFFIHEPKRRLISAAPFRDRVVHHALCNLIEPIFERSFVAESFANRRGKGTHRALDHCQRLARRFPFVLQLDVRQFFPSIDHAILRQALERKVRDPAVHWLIELILDSGRGVLDEVYDMVYFPGDDLFAINRPRGLPIGNLTSQIWANVYMSPIDHCAKRELRCRGYLRYVDDLVLFGEDKSSLWHAKEVLVEHLEALRLTIHPGAHPQPVGEGIPFLGVVVFPERRRLKRRKGTHFFRRFRDAVEAHEAGALPLRQLQAVHQGWVNHVRYANTAGLRKALLSEIPPHLAELARPKEKQISSDTAGPPLRKTRTPDHRRRTSG